MIDTIGRFRITLSILTLFTVMGFPVFAVATDSSPRPWPMAIDINLASSFGEYRSGHFHAGVDIKTYGREGVPCLAVGDGYVSRLRASPYGYGKAIYLTLSGGETVVYAHLAEFSTPLAEELYAQQVDAGRYRVDVYYDAGRFPMRRGDVLGYSGRTGASAPHLHFELRDEDQNPMNPLSWGWSLEDKVEPQFRGVAWIPLAASSRIQGVCRSLDVALAKTSAGTWVCRDTVTVWGRLGLGADVVDRLNSASGRLAPYRVELTVDGVLLSSIEMERFSYSHTGEVELAYEMGRVRRTGRHYLLMFKRTGETLWNRSFVNNGVIDTELLPVLIGKSRSHYTAVVRAIDRAGNVSVVSIPFRIGKNPRLASIVPAGDEGLSGYYFFGDVLAASDGYGVPASLLGGGLGDGRPFQWAVRDIPETRRVVQISRRDAVVDLIVVRAGRSGRDDFRDLGLRVVTRAQSLYGDGFVFVAPWSGALNKTSFRTAGLVPAGTAVRLGPGSAAMKKGFELGWRLDSEPGEAGGPGLGEAASGLEAGGPRLDPSGVGVYQLDEREGGWQFKGGEVTGDTIVVTVRAPGVYAVFVDRQPPRIAAPRAEVYKSFASGKTRRRIVVEITDKGSGLDPELTEIWVDGARRIARWDGFSDRMYVLLDKVAPAMSAREIRVIARDRSGNTATREKTLEFSQKIGNGRGEESGSHGE